MPMFFNGFYFNSFSLIHFQSNDFVFGLVPIDEKNS